MITSDIFAVLQWWGTLLLLGVGFLPLTVLLFDKFFDKGYIFSKLLGLALTSYVIFLIGVLHIVPFSIVSAYLIFILVAGGMYLLLPQKWKILYILKRYWKIFLFEEGLFLVALFVWAYVHSFAPDIHGLEKYMDFGFVNSILRSDYFPPKDMWFTPFFINYYYFGHFMTAILTKMSTVPSNISFNLMLSTIFAFCFVETFSIGANLYTFLRGNMRLYKVNVIIAGLLTSFLVTFAGNLHIIYAFFKPYIVDNPQPFWQLQFLPATFPNAYWYPNATRYIFHTIHEFPIYSWVVADLHGHVLDIPFVLLIVALLLAIFASHNSPKSEEEKAEKPMISLPLPKNITDFFSTFSLHPLLLIFIGFLLAIMYMTNAWDGAIYLLLTIFVLTYLHWQQSDRYQSAEEPIKVIAHAKDAKKIKINRGLLLWGRDLLFSVLFVLAGFTLFSLPYNAFFKPFASGIGVLCAPDFLISIGKIGPLLFEKDHCQHSYWWELLTLYGFFYFFAISFLVFLIRVKKIIAMDNFVLLLLLLSTILIVLPEFIYLKDIYPAHYRANTMFKLVFQAFILLSICSGYIIYRLLSPTEAGDRPQKRAYYFPFLICTIGLVTLVMLYPNQAINAYYGNFKTYHNLDGTAYLKTQYPTDFAAIQWLNTNIKGQPVILEAQGDSYTDYARVSANTGLPTVLGWTVHEWLWRGSYDVPAPRINEIKTMYETKDPQEAKKLLEKYHVQYVFIGALEPQKYPQLSEEKFGQIGKLVFQDGTTKIYELNR